MFEAVSENYLLCDTFVMIRLELTNMRAGLFNILIACCFFCSCASPNQNIVVVDHSSPSGTKVLYHVVAPGETLYAIAWRYNLNYKNLARVNGIGRNYLIYPGQKIRLSDAFIEPSVVKKPVLSRSQSKPATKKPAPYVHTKPAAKRLEKTSIKANKPPAVKKMSNSTGWLWPANGPVVDKFESNKGLHKGIDIGGKLGEPVNSASAGEVVYAGEGLRGYGKLIIIKHSDKYLSAYGHNKKILVGEGDNVTAGQKIALLGSTGTDKVKLHFEIRYEGRPIDPLSKLPKR